jgi:CspA family cold shock protein
MDNESEDRQVTVLNGERKSGKVKWFRGSIGFIEQDSADGEDLPDLFAHYSNIEMEGFKILKPKDAVTFVAAEAKRGPIALQIRKA